MEENKPKSIFEQIIMGMQVINENILDLFRITEDLHNIMTDTKSDIMLPKPSRGSENEDITGGIN